jgi:ribonuclease HII
MSSVLKTRRRTIEGLPDTPDIEAWLTRQGYSAICGVDEVGRGPLAGPVVAAAVIYPADLVIAGLDDSKKLTPRKRQSVFDQIAQLGLVCAVGILDHQAVDSLNIHQASLLAMRKAVSDLSQQPDFVLVDGNFKIPNLARPQFPIVGGDARCRAIAAASVVAKVTRDRIMEHYEQIYPEFSFSVHKGYPTPLHLRELRDHGPTDIHRRSYRPVADLVKSHGSF